MSPRRRFATLQDVAERADVSPRTVSNVVNGVAHVNGAMRERVLAAVADLDYRPIGAGRALQGHPEQLVTLVIPDLAIAYYAELARAVGVRAREHGLRLVLEQTDGESGAESAAARRVLSVSAGALFFPLGLPLELLEPLAAARPVVLVGDHGRGTTLDHVFIDSVAVGRAATEHLLSRGRRRIAFLGSPNERPHTAAHAREQGFRDALAGHGLEVDPRRLRPLTEWSEAGGLVATGLLLVQEPGVDGIVAASDAVAVGALRALRLAGRRVPEDVAVVGIDDVAGAAFADPPLTTVAIDREGMARAAVQLLADRFTGYSGPGRTRAAGISLVLRASS